MPKESQGQKLQMTTLETTLELLAIVGKGEVGVVIWCAGLDVDVVGLVGPGAILLLHDCHSAGVDDGILNDRADRSILAVALDVIFARGIGKHLFRALRQITNPFLALEGVGPSAELSIVGEQGDVAIGIETIVSQGIAVHQFRNLRLGYNLFDFRHTWRRRQGGRRNSQKSSRKGR